MLGKTPALLYPDMDEYQLVERVDDESGHQRDRACTQERLPLV